MFKIKRLFILCIITLGLGFASCKSRFEKLRLSNDIAKKYAEGIRLYNKKDYAKALILFEELSQKYRGRDGSEDLNYYFAFTLFRMKDYPTARYKFKEFADTYPTSKNAEECRYMGAYCYFLDSSDFTLDQENTHKAIDALQLFINLYPKSERVTQASQYISDLRGKLELKAFENSKLYYTLGGYQPQYYKAAVIALKNTELDFPDIKYVQEIDLLIIKSQYMYAYNSYADFQEARYNEAIGFYNEFTEAHPESKYAKEALELKNSSLAGIENAKKILAANAAEIAKFEALQKLGVKKQKDTTVIKTDIKTPSN